jgi:hypothetical protein
MSFCTGRSYKLVITSMLSDLNLPPLEDRRRNIRLAYFYKVVEGVVPAIPPQKYPTTRKPGRNIRAKNFQSNVVLTKNEFLYWSVLQVGTAKPLLLLQTDLLTMFMVLKSPKFFARMFLPGLTILPKRLTRP